MTAFEDGLWSRLVEEHDADQVYLRGTSPQRRGRPAVIGGSVCALAAAIAIGVLVLTATTGAPPAYALTRDANGVITVTINDLRAAIPALRARFAATGIDETVVPVEAGCRTSGRFAGAPLFVYAQEAPGATLTFNPGSVPAGYTGVLAAEQLPGGGVAMAEVAIEPTVPSCFPAIAFRVQNTADTKSIPTYLMTPVNSVTTDPGSGAARARRARRQMRGAAVDALIQLCRVTKRCTAGEDQDRSRTARRMRFRSGDAIQASSSACGFGVDAATTRRTDTKGNDENALVIEGRIHPCEPPRGRESPVLCSPRAAARGCSTD